MDKTNQCDINIG